MRSIALLFILTTLLSATILTNHNIYKQEDSVDLMLTFNEPYIGKISKKGDGKDTILMLENLKLEDTISENIESNIVQEIKMVPYKNQTFIKVSSKRAYTIQASKTVDNYGLRIRVKPKVITPIKSPKLITKKESDISGSFIKLISVLGLIIALLYLLKNWVLNKNQTSTNWLFHKDPSKKQNIKLLYQKALDTKNRVALLQYNGYDYLVILGTNNIILDKYKSQTDEAVKEFDKILNQNSSKLDQLLKMGEKREL